MNTSLYKLQSKNVGGNYKATKLQLNVAPEEIHFMQRSTWKNRKDWQKKKKKKKIKLQE